MSHPDPTHDPENVKEEDVLDQANLNAYYDEEKFNADDESDKIKEKEINDEWEALRDINQK